MPSDDEWVYVFVLLLTIILGVLCNRLNDPFHKKLFSAASGFILLICCSQLQSLHAIITVVVNTAIIRCLKDCKAASFCFCFGYLYVFRSPETFNFNPPLPFANAIQLILTLRVVGVAFEVADSRKRKEHLLVSNSKPIQDAKLQAKEQLANWKIVEPSTLDLVLYCFCYLGMMTGPFYTYKTYEDFVENKRKVPPANYLKLNPKLRNLLVYIPLFMVVSSLFQNESLRQDWFYEDTTIGYRIIYAIGCYAGFRIRFYVAWILAEFACVTAGLGAYPKNSKTRPGMGPTLSPVYPEKSTYINSDEYDFETIRNIDEYAVEMETTIRGVLKTWNKTVQYWLVWIVHKRFHENGKVLAMVATMTVSAYWHGLHGGYYLALLTVPYFYFTEAIALKALSQWKESKWFTFGQWFFRNRAFDYMSVGFLLINGSDTWRYWSSIYFIGHGFAGLVLIISLIKLKVLVKKDTKEE